MKIYSYLDHPMSDLLIRLKALSDSKRLQIIQILKECDSCRVGDLVSKLGCEQSLVSHNLAILRQSGLVSSWREGRNIHYSLDKKGLAEVKELLFES